MKIEKINLTTKKEKENTDSKTIKYKWSLVYLNGYEKNKYLKALETEKRERELNRIEITTRKSWLSSSP